MKKIIIALLSLLTVPKLMLTPVLAQTKSMEIEKLMSLYNEFDMINGVILVAEGDKTLYKNAFGTANFEWNIPNQIESKFEIASVSKQFTAIMILQLIDQRLLSLNTKVKDILKDYPEINGNKITIEHLLSHTSGLIDTQHIPNFDNNLGTQPHSRDKLLATFKDSTLLFEPGAKWSYSNFGYNLLAIILETITKKDINELLNEKIFKPCGMIHSTTLEDKGVINQKTVGYELDYYSKITRGFYHDPSWSVGSGNIVTTVEDYFKYYQAYNEGKLLSQKMMEQLTKIETFVDAESDNKVMTQFCFMQDKLFNKKDTIVFPYTSGSHFGVHTVAYHFYKNKKLILLFINLKIAPMKMFEIGDNISKILYGFPYESPKDSYLRLFSKDIKEKGINEAISRYRKLKSEQKDNLSQTPRDFNRHGYHYLRNGHPEIAVKIFKLNLEIYPNNPDLFDSLGEAYLKVGNKAEALKNYKKSLELDPKNENAKKMIEKIKAN